MTRLITLTGHYCKQQVSHQSLFFLLISHFLSSFSLLLSSFFFLFLLSFFFPSLLYFFPESQLIRTATSFINQNCITGVLQTHRFCVKYESLFYPVTGKVVFRGAKSKIIFVTIFSRGRCASDSFFYKKFVSLSEIWIKLQKWSVLELRL